MTWGGQQDAAKNLRRRRFELMGHRPPGSRWSNYLAGRCKSLRILDKGEPIVVSAYLYNGRMRYSDPCNTPANKAGPHVLYRVIVRPKK